MSSAAGVLSTFQSAFPALYAADAAAAVAAAEDALRAVSPDVIEATALESPQAAPASPSKNKGAAPPPKNTKAAAQAAAAAAAAEEAAAAETLAADIAAAEADRLRLLEESTVYFQRKSSITDKVCRQSSCHCCDVLVSLVLTI